MPKRGRKEYEDLDIDEAPDAPTSINPYEVLFLGSDATQDDVKKAYRKAALKYHPDKAASQDKDAAHVKFQEIALAYAVLSDERRRKRYDTTGSTEETLNYDDDDFDWATFYREQFQSVTTEAIDSFAKGYKGSDEEATAVLDAYTKHQGSMVKLYQEVMLSDMTEDEDRFRRIIDQAIDSGEVESYTKYTGEKESTRQKRIEQERKRKAREAPEAEEAAEEIRDKAGKKNGNKKAKGEGEGGFGELAALIQKRQQGRQADFFSNLEAKYAPKGKKGAAKDEPSEEAFAKNREGLSKKSGRGKR